MGHEGTGALRAEEHDEEELDLDSRELHPQDFDDEEAEPEDDDDFD